MTVPQFTNIFTKDPIPINIASFFSTKIRYNTTTHAQQDQQQPRCWHRNEIPRQKKKIDRFPLNIYYLNIEIALCATHLGNKCSFMSNSKRKAGGMDT